MIPLCIHMCIDFHLSLVRSLGDSPDSISDIPHITLIMTLSSSLLRIIRKKNWQNPSISSNISWYWHYFSIPVSCVVFYQPETAECMTHKKIVPIKRISNNCLWLNCKLEKWHLQWIFLAFLLIKIKTSQSSVSVLSVCLLSPPQWFKMISFHCFRKRL